MGKNNFTRGEWRAYKLLSDLPPDVSVNGEDVVSLDDFIGDGFEVVREEERDANAKLIAAAGTAATKLADMGYDAQRCIDLLPEIMNLLPTLIDFTAGQSDADNGVPNEAMHLCVDLEVIYNKVEDE